MVWAEAAGTSLGGFVVGALVSWVWFQKRLVAKDGELAQGRTDLAMAESRALNAERAEGTAQQRASEADGRVMDLEAQLGVSRVALAQASERASRVPGLESALESARQAERGAKEHALTAATAAAERARQLEAAADNLKEAQARERGLVGRVATLQEDLGRTSERLLTPALVGMR